MLINLHLCLTVLGLHLASLWFTDAVGYWLQVCRDCPQQINEEETLMVAINNPVRWQLIAVVSMTTRAIFSTDVHHYYLSHHCTTSGRVEIPNLPY